MSEAQLKQAVVASFTCSTGKLQKLLNDTALKDGSEPFHDDIYIQFSPDRVETLVAKPNNSALAFNTYGETYFDSLDYDGDYGELGAVVRVGQTLDYLGLIDQGTVDVEFLEESDGLAQFIRISGAINVTRKLPAAQEILDRVPMALPERFDEDQRFTSTSGGTHTTNVSTTIDQLEKIHRAVELDQDADFYPVATRDENFRIELGVDGDGNSERASVEGNLAADSVEGEDASEWFNTGFEEAVKTLTGDVDLSLAEGAPLVFVQTGEGYIVRHILGPVEST